MRLSISRHIGRVVAALLVVFAFSFPISIKWIIEASPRARATPATQHQTCPQTDAEENR